MGRGGGRGRAYDVAVSGYGLDCVKGQGRPGRIASPAQVGTDTRTRRSWVWWLCLERVKIGANRDDGRNFPARWWAVLGLNQ